ncbi:hypothetical protein PoB_005599000, partial [Plakobranchus ocellatus]
VASTFLACLDTKDNLPDCASVKPAIKALRDQYASQISAQGCSSGPVLCTKDIQNCQQQFVVDDTKAGNDNTKACLAGEALGNCLTSIQGRPECGGAQALIDSIRGAYHDQINTQGCAAITRPAQTQCQKDVVACEQTFQTSVQAAPNNAIAQCNAGVVFMACLDNYDHKIECLAAQSAISSMRAIFSKQITSAGCGDGAKPTVTACQGDVLNCVQTFSNAIKVAPNNVDAQCSAGAALTKCFDDKDKAPECAAVKDTIASLRKTFSSQIRTAGCAGNADPSNPKIKCSLDITDCEGTFQTQVQDAGTDIKASCFAGAALTKCFDDKDKAPECAAVKDTIASLRKTFSSQIRTAGCAGNADPSNPKIKCSLDITDCEGTFQTQVQDAGTDIKASCLAGATLESCLKQLEKRPECSSASTTIDQMRDLYKQQIDQTNCVSKAAEDCAIGVQTCSMTFHTNFQAQKNDDGRCKTANTYITCLNGVTCSKSFEAQLSTAVMMTQQMLSNNTASCELVQLHGAATSLTASTVTFLTGLLVVLYARLQ